MLESIIFDDRWVSLKFRNVSLTYKKRKWASIRNNIKVYLYSCCLFLERKNIKIILKEMKIYQKSYLNVQDLSVHCGQVYEKIKLQSNTAAL